MSQHIGLEIINENFETLKKTDCNLSGLLKEVYAKGIDTSASLLSTIDPYGLTVFNYNQAQIIKLEINKLINLNITNENMSQLVKLLEEVGTIEIHQFIKLIGD